MKGRAQNAVFHPDAGGREGGREGNHVYLAEVLFSKCRAGGTHAAAYSPSFPGCVAGQARELHGHGNDGGGREVWEAVKSLWTL